MVQKSEQYQFSINMSSGIVGEFLILFLFPFYLEGRLIQNIDSWSNSF